VYSVGSEGPNAHPFYHLMMALISMSIILQVRIRFASLKERQLDLILYYFTNGSKLEKTLIPDYDFLFHPGQITTGLCLILIGKKIEGPYFRNADVINNFVTAQVFLITVLNILISSFGIEESVQRTRKLAAWEATNRDYFHNCTCIEPTRLFYSMALRTCV